MDNNDLKPEQWQIYGYCVLQQAHSKDHWTVETHEDYSNMPDFEPFIDVAKDRCSYLREHGIDCRVVALVTDPDYDTPERMDNAKIERTDDDQED
tara:strand:- start:51 stop:335 length:285 start_codon:yes stop_codon:yes gene_type:complete